MSGFGEVGGWAAARRPAWFVPAAVFAVALAVRLVIVAVLPNLYDRGIADSYDVIAVNLLHGRGFGYVSGVPTVARAPYFPVHIAAVYALVGESLTALRVTAAAGDALVAALVVVFVRAATATGSRPVSLSPAERTRLAALAGLLYAAQPVTGYYAAKLVPETWLTLWLVLAAVCFARWWRGGGWTWALPLGIAAGVASLNKTVALGLALGVLAATLARTARRGIDRRLLAQSLAVLLVALAVVAPWTVRNGRVAHAFVPVQTMTWYAFWYDFEAGPSGAARGRAAAVPAGMRKPPTLTAVDDVRQERSLAREARSWMWAHPLDMAGKTAANAVEFWYFVETQGRSWAMIAFALLTLPWALAGVWLTLRDRRLRLLGAVCVVVIVYLDLLYAPILAVFRYSLPAWPFVAALAAVAVQAAWGAARRRPAAHDRV